VDDEHVEGALGEQPLRLPRAGRVDHFVAGIAKRTAKRLENLFLVVDEKNGSAVCDHQRNGACSTVARRAPSSDAGTGNSIRISVPAPGALVTAMVPPRPSTMFFAIGRPRPVPPRRVVK